MLSALVAKASWATSSPGESLAFLASFAAGTAAGYRVVRAAFRRGRQRQGRDPEPGPPNALKMFGAFFGFWIKLLLGFAFWALLVSFFRRV